MTKPDRWIEVFHADGRWHWQVWANRGNLPDIAVTAASRGYAWKSGAKRAARRENPGLAVLELPKA